MLARGFFDGLRPEPRMTVDVWADTNRYLSPVASAEPGKWRTDRAPYLKEILEKLSSFDITQEVVVMKGAQLGLTEAGNCWIGYVIDAAPGPMLMVMPTDETVKRNSTTRIAPMIEATPKLRERVKPARSRDSENTITQKKFPGGVLIMTGANSPAALRSMPIRYLFLDEVDGYPLDIDGEGSPIDLAEARTRTFSKKKIFKISTPTVDGASAIQNEFHETDQRYFFVPCPECDEYQTIEFENIKWEEGKPETAALACTCCGSLIEERYKTTMLQRGEWRATVEEKASERKVGYHINSLYSPYGWYSWEQAARDWLDAQGDDNKLKTFTNTVLGETWKEKGDAPDWENIYNRRESYPTNKLKQDVAFLTCGVDVQKDRLELEIVGWMEGKRSQSVDYRVLLGETTEPQVWEQLTEVLNEVWEREDGIILPLRLMAVDSGYNTSHVYQFCRKHDPTRVIPVKGSDTLQVIVSTPRTVDVTIDGKKHGTTQLWQVGVGMIKSETYGYLRLNPNEDGSFPNGYCHFPQYAPEFFKGITAEQLEYKIVRGYKKFQWVKKYERNEPLDTRVYARAAAYVVGMDRFEEHHWQAIIEQFAVNRPKPQPRQTSARRKSSFWDR